jgi:hypothetical protein
MSPTPTEPPSWGSRDDQAKFWKDRGLSGQAAYESDAVAFFLRRLGLSRMADEIGRAARDVTGARRLTFAAAEEVVRGFPIRFRVGMLHGIRRLAVPDLFDRFTKTPLYTGFEDIIEDHDLDGQAAGLVFRWISDTTVAGRKQGGAARKGISGGKFMVIHNSPASSGMARNTRLIRDTDLGTIVVESMAGLLANFEGWTPD